VTPDARSTNPGRSVLVVMTGLPGTGKSSIAQAIATALPAAYLAVDPVHGELETFGQSEWDPEGRADYAVVRRLARVQLRLGLSAVVDAVNPLDAIRADYRAIAVQHEAAYVLLATTCADEHLHWRRVDAKRLHGPGPVWAEVERQRSYYETPRQADLVLDANKAMPANIETSIAAVRDCLT
jgi:predicted kinase